MLRLVNDDTGVVDGPEEARLATELRAARAKRKSKNRLFRSICDSLHKQLSQNLTEHKEQVINIVLMGGALRVGIETAVPDDKVVNLDERKDDLPFDPPAPPNGYTAPSNGYTIYPDR